MTDVTQQAIQWVQHYGMHAAAAGCLGCVFGAYVVNGLLVPDDQLHTDNARLLRQLHEKEDEKKEKKNVLEEGVLDLRRKAYIVRGGAFDLSGHVVIHGNADFDAGKTIFHSLRGVASRIIRDKVGIQLFWTETANTIINTAFAKIPAAPSHDRAIGEFMTNECNFNMEHADGSFMDHLMFCYEYSAQHYKQYSPRVLFLHSIMGVGTNFFPMEKEKIPKLRTLVNEFEFEHIAMFPSILRLLYSGKMLDELSALATNEPLKLKQLDKVVFYRVIDNVRMEISAEALWIQLNYQLIHLLDFLPFVSWRNNVEDSFLGNFGQLHELLETAGQLQCKVDYNVTEVESSRAGQHVSLATAIAKLFPKVARSIARKQAAKFSNVIGHKLDYELHFQ